MQAKRIQIIHTELTGLAQNTVQLNTPTDPREEVNFHNIWGSFSVEPETAGANAAGVWVLFKLPVAGVIPGWSLVNINGEGFSPMIIACGAWAASNENPYTSPPIHPETSRTLQPGEALCLSVNVHGITTGEVSINTLLCAHTTRK